MRTKLFLFFLILIGFFYRLYGLDANYSFWTDEEHVAIFSRAILERGKPILANGYSTGIYQWLQYWLSAISAKIFGLNEFAIRLPSVIFGVLTIWAVYLLAKELFVSSSTSEESLRLRPAPSGAGLRSGPPSEVFVPLVAAALTTFLKIEILWSRQARPYQALQLFLILGAYFIYRLGKEKKFNCYCLLFFLGCGIFAFLMHGLGFVIFFSGFIYLLIFKASWFGKKWILLGLFPFVLIGWIFRVFIFSIFSQIGKFNNFYYYRIFLTHNYLSLCLSAFLGVFLLIWRKKYQVFFLFAIFLGVQIIIVSFFLEQPFSRYFYPVFPFIILLASYGILEIRNKTISLFLILLVVFPLWNSDKLSLLPQKTYSLNEDMQEIPEVDWKKIYGFVEEKLKQNLGLVLATNWSDLPVWYLGEGKLDFLLRKPGQTKIEKEPFSSASMLYSLEELEKTIKENKNGILVIDSWDDRVPDGIREFSRDNLKKELEIDRLYPIQPRYWPVEVYSWGMD